MPKNLLIKSPKHACGNDYTRIGLLVRKLSEKESEDAGNIYHCANCDTYSLLSFLDPESKREFPSHKELSDFIREEGNLTLI